MLKRIVLLAAVAVATLALAIQAGTTGSYGHGTATDGHGRFGSFDYNVKQVRRSQTHRL